MNSNTALILTAAAFAMIGFTLGRVTAPHPPVAKHMEIFKQLDGAALMGCGESGEVQVIVKAMEAGDFEGDTVFAIPGGTVHMVKTGDEIDVQVEMEEGEVNEWVEKSSDGVVIKKRIVVTEED